MKLAPFLLAIALSVACESSHDPELMDAGVDSMPLDSMVPDSVEADAGPPRFPPERALETQGSCDRIAGYELKSTEEPALLWSYAHTFIRSFGDHASPWAIDAHLVTALSQDLEVGVVSGDPRTFGTYAELVPSTCYAGVWDLPEAVYESTRDDIQWLRPGAPVSIEAENVILDLRNVPEGPSLDAFLAEFAELALERVDTVAARYRSFNGLPDEGYIQQFIPGAAGAYRGRVTNGILNPIQGSNDSGARIGILLGARVAPSAARFALALRLSGRAAILGESLPVNVAERVAAPVVDGAFFTRVFEVVSDDTLPDVIDADIPSADPQIIEEAFQAFDLASLDPIDGESSRGALRDIVQTNRVVATDRGEASRQAALIILHGVAKRFFAYWDVVDSDHDERLMEAMAFEYPLELEGEELEEYYQIVFSIRYFAHSLMDSHVTPFVALGAEPFPDFGAPNAVLPVYLDHTDDGHPVVRATNSSDFAVGDVIEAIDGEPVLERIDEFLEYTSSSTSSRMRNGLNLLRVFRDPRVLAIRAADGTLRDVEVEPVPDTAPVTYLTRPRGPLADIGYPELYYVDLSADAMSGANLSLLHRTLAAYEGLVLDMRGYPSQRSWSFIRDLMQDGGPGPRMQEVLQGPTTRRVRNIPQPSAPSSIGYEGRIMILTAPTTQSSAEHLVLTLSAAGRAEVVGRPSAGANGNITSVALPGAFGVSFTGLVVLQNDDSLFHGVGVPVHHPVTILPEELAAGLDPELQRAAEVLAPPSPTSP